MKDQHVRLLADALLGIAHVPPGDDLSNAVHDSCEKCAYAILDEIQRRERRWYRRAIRWLDSLTETWGCP